ncbi:MAG: hypothetical protein ACPLTR_07265, partial [Thermacetogeniaceae bacterium]
MRVLIISANPEALADFLKQAGHEARESMTTDLVSRVLDEFFPDAAVFCEDAAEMPPVSRRDALREAASRVRVVLLAGRENPLVPYAAALGVKDFVFLPAAPAAVLHRLENPASAEEAAAMIDGVKLKAPEPEELLGEEEPARKRERRLPWKLRGRGKPKETEPAEAPESREEREQARPERGPKEEGARLREPPPRKSSVVLVLSAGDPSAAALALAREIASAEGACSVIDLDPEARLTKALGLGPEAFWQNASGGGTLPNPRVLVEGGSPIVVWGTAGGDTAGHEEALRAVASVQLIGGHVVACAGGRGAFWRLAGELEGLFGADLGVTLCIDPPEGAPVGRKSVVILTRGDAGEARRRAD